LNLNGQNIPHEHALNFGIQGKLSYCFGLRVDREAEMTPSQKNESERQEETVVVHRADSWTEAVVIRGLLESAGIPSPPLTRTDPYPFSNPPAEFPGAEVLVRESDVEEARRIIDEYRRLKLEFNPTLTTGR
jgi:hypothetical protein